MTLTLHISNKEVKRAGIEQADIDAAIRTWKILFAEEMKDADWEFATLFESKMNKKK